MIDQFGNSLSRRKFFGLAGAASTVSGITFLSGYKEVAEAETTRPKYVKSKR